MSAPPDRLAYVVMLNARKDEQPDALGVVDVDPSSSSFGRMLSRVEMPNPGDELHHFGWNACSSCLCPYAPHPHVERRYLVVPGINSSRIHILDVKQDPTRPKIAKVIEPEEVFARSGYSAPHTVHCGPDGIYVGALGSPDGEGPGGVMVLDHDSFEILGPWEIERGDQYLAYDFWWHLGYDTMVTSEWGTPNMVKSGLDPRLLMAGKYGHRLHVWDLHRRRHRQTLELGADQQMALELRPAHDPRRAYGFAGVTLSLKDLSGSIWLWQRDPATGRFDAEKVITIAAEPASEDRLPEMLEPFKAVPPLVTDINLSLDDRILYVACWGTGKLQQYDVSDPRRPRLVGQVEIGGIVERRGHPSRPDRPLNGGPQMVEVSRDGKRVYFTNSLYSPWDDQFYPDGIRSWMVKADVHPEGGIQLDPRFFLESEDLRMHQIRLQGGDASSDSFCFS